MIHVYTENKNPLQLSVYYFSSAMHRDQLLVSTERRNLLENKNLLILYIAML